MKPTFHLGRFAGIPVGAHWSVLVTVFLLADLLAVSILPAVAPGVGPAGYWVTALAVSVVFVLSLLAHESPTPRWAAGSASGSRASRCGCSAGQRCSRTSRRRPERTR